MSDRTHEKDHTLADKRVAVVACPDYDPGRVRECLLRAFVLIEGGDLIAPGKGSAYIKPNIVMGSAPATARTTHPAVVGQLASLFAAAGYDVLAGDCPGFYTDSPSLRRIYRQGGYTSAIEEAGGRMSDDLSGERVKLPPGSALRDVPMVSLMIGADRLVNAAKLKTHSLMGMTGAVKNLFGVVPGIYKAELHARYPRYDDMADALIDICEAAGAAVHIIDGVVGMEGAGPTAGSPRRLGVLLAGRNPYTVDVAAARLMGMQPGSLPILRRAAARGYLSPGFSDVELLGDDPGPLTARPPFKTATIRDHILIRTVGRVVPERVKNALRVKPAVNGSSCIGCGNCSRACPSRAIDMSTGRPVIDHSSCIRCFCCQELCPRQAVDLVRGNLLGVFRGNATPY